MQEKLNKENEKHVGGNISMTLTSGFLSNYVNFDEHQQM